MNLPVDLPKTPPQRKPSVDDEAGKLKRCLGVPDLIAFGFNSMVGAGIFVVVGAATTDAGPAVLCSICISSFACACSGLCFAEFASALPSSGSGYAYLYVVIGELPAFLCAHLLSLSMSVAGGIACRAATGYLAVSFAEVTGVGERGMIGTIVEGLLGDHTIVDKVLVLNIFSPLLCLGLTLLLLRGTQDSSLFNNIMAVINVTLLLLFIIVGFFNSDSDNWQDLAPRGTSGVVQASGLMFYSYVGFDAVCTLSQEAKQPQFSIPAGMLGSLFLVTALYCGVASALIGMTPLADINLNAPLSHAFLGHGLKVMFHLVTVAAVTNTLATAFAGIMAQPRLWIHIAKDGLAPISLSKLDHRQVPRMGQTLAGGLGMVLCCAFPIELLADLCSGGILFAYIMVSFSLLVLRWGNVLDLDSSPSSSSQPKLNRSLFALLMTLNIAVPCVPNICSMESKIAFLTTAVGSGFFLVLLGYHVCRYGQGQTLTTVIEREFGSACTDFFLCPCFPFTPCVAIAVNSYVISGMGANAVIATALWILFGVLLYAGYGYRNSRLVVGAARLS